MSHAIDQRPMTSPATKLRAQAALMEIADTLEPTVRRLRSGDTLFKAGDRCTSIHILDGGLVRLAAQDGADDDDAVEAIVTSAIERMIATLRRPLS